MGRFCAQCGQKRIEPEERRVAWFVRQLIEAVTMVDERFLGSLTRLLFRPGRLERDWLSGRRRRHLAPLTLFLIANLVYFVAPPLTDFNLSLHDQVTSQPWRTTAAALVDARLIERGVSFEHYAREYGARADDLAKLLIILQVPVLAFVLMLTHWRQRLYFVDHLAVSLNFHAFLLIATLVLPPVLIGVVHDLGGSNRIWQLTLLALMLAYVGRQLQVAYAQRIWLALLKLPLFVIGLGVAHFTYRAMQFALAFALT